MRVLLLELESLVLSCQRSNVSFKNNNNETFLLCLREEIGWNDDKNGAVQCTVFVHLFGFQLRPWSKPGLFNNSLFQWIKSTIDMHYHSPELGNGCGVMISFWPWLTEHEHDPIAIAVACGCCFCSHNHKNPANRILHLRQTNWPNHVAFLSPFMLSAVVVGCVILLQFLPLL